MNYLFVCTGNTCRSPMAASLLPDDLGQAESAGLAAWPGEPAAPEAISAVARLGGRDLASHRSRRLDQLDLSQFDWILTMTFRQREQILVRWPELSDRVRTVGEMAGETSLEIDDPFGGPQPVYDRTATQLQRLISQFPGSIDKNF